jgi:hypothetical protein
MLLPALFFTVYRTYALLQKLSFTQHLTLETLNFSLDSGMLLISDTCVVHDELCHFGSLLDKH